jgi:signal transduction histidine kinase
MTLHAVPTKRTRVDQAEQLAGLNTVRSDQSRPVLKSLVDALDMPVALLDECTRIIATNLAWNKFGRHYGRVGASFDDICKSRLYAEVAEVSEASCKQLGLVLAGKGNSFETSYRINTKGASGDFRLRVARLRHYSPRRLLVTLQEISELVRAKDTANELAQRVLEIQAEERQRFATELHDTVGQYFVSLELSLARLRMETAPSTSATELIQDMSVALKEAQAEIRTLSYLLSPPWIEYERGLERAIRGFVQGFAKRASLKADIHVQGPPLSLDQSRQLTLFRMVQEALVNVYRHAKADAVAVNLMNQEAKVTLEVTDNGTGFLGANTGTFGHGAGLAGMRARIRHFGGDFQIHTGSAGTTLTATLPTN